MSKRVDLQAADVLFVRMIDSAFLTAAADFPDYKDWETADGDTVLRDLSYKVDKVSASGTVEEGESKRLIASWEAAGTKGGRRIGTAGTATICQKGGKLWYPVQVACSISGISRGERPRKSRSFTRHEDSYGAYEVVVS